MEKLITKKYLSFVLFSQLLFSFSVYAADTAPPLRFLVIGASLSDKMGGSLSGLNINGFPTLDMIFKDNTSPGERVKKQVQARLKELGHPLATKVYYKKKSMLNIKSSHFYSWIKKKFKPNKAESYDIVFALDLFYKDFRAFKAFSEIESIPYQAEKLEIAKKRFVDIANRFGYGAKQTWIGSPLAHQFKKDKDGNILKDEFGDRVPKYQGVVDAYHWMKRVLAGEEPDYQLDAAVQGKVHFFDLKTPFEAAKYDGEVYLEYSDQRYLIQRKNIISPDGWHPSKNGNKALANLLIQKISDLKAEWAHYMPFIAVEGALPQ